MHPHVLPRSLLSPLPFSIHLLHSPRQNCFCFHVSMKVSQQSENRHTALLSPSILGVSQKHLNISTHRSTAHRSKVIVPKSLSINRGTNKDSMVCILVFLHIYPKPLVLKNEVLSPCPGAEGGTCPGRKCGIV